MDMSATVLDTPSLSRKPSSCRRQRLRVRGRGSGAVTLAAMTLDALSVIITIEKEDLSIKIRQ